jgi:hypothetical protein
VAGLVAAQYLDLGWSSFDLDRPGRLAAFSLVGGLLAWGCGLVTARPALRSHLVAAALGGVGMLLGGSLEPAAAVSAGCHRAGPPAAAPADLAASLLPGRWEVAAMLLCCAPVCVFSCRRLTALRRWLEPLASLVGMTLGMASTGLAMPALAAHGGLMSVPAHHLAMLVGMAAGSCLAARAARAAARRFGLPGEG